MDMIKCKHGNFGECDLCGDIVKKYFADMETASEPIQNALYAAGFTTEQCDQLTDGILQYIEDAGLFIVKTNVNLDELQSVFNVAVDDWISDLESEDIYILPELLEKMKDFKELIESQVFS